MNPNNQDDIAFIDSFKTPTITNNNVKDKHHQQQQEEYLHLHLLHNHNNIQSVAVNDDHEHDLVMPGFRFYPTEEELIEFYLRRKVEGKRFNVELITFLDLYRFDPWELPALAAMGEKEWFFYVPRDRKYRNGDRPNRVTTSGYWKATGADRMIRAENNRRSIGLKKTLVFYTGKAPKGIRTSWIMNEYRLPQLHTHLHLKAEISLCRVYKRAGVDDHPSVPRGVPFSEKKGQSSMMAQQQLSFAPPPQPPQTPPAIVDRMARIKMKEHQEEEDVGNRVIPFLGPSSTFMHNDHHHNTHDQQDFLHLGNNTSHTFSLSNYLFSPSTSLLLPSSMASSGANNGGLTFSERLWEWNPSPDPNN